MDIDQLLKRIDPVNGTIAGATTVKRHLSDLRGCFHDESAYERALAGGNPLVYSVASVEPASGPGDLHYGLGTLMPGRIGSEYFMTKGHLHSWREAAEIYIGLAGEGALLLEEESIGESRLVPLRPDHVIYVPGYTAHRTINIGQAPLAYLGIYPAKAGHDYAAIARRNFRCLVVEHNNQPGLIQRDSL